MNTPELVASILKKGGKCLIAGGEVGNFPKEYQEHPQLILWDDNVQEYIHKEIPSNVKIIMWSRWLSHAHARKLNNAAKDLRAIKFPLLKPREIKHMLAEFMQADAVELTNGELDKAIEETIAKQDEMFAPDEPVFLPSDLVESSERVNEAITAAENITEKDYITVPKKTIVAAGELTRFVARNINLHIDYKVRGSQSKEGKRLFDKAKSEGLKTTASSVIQAVGVIARSIGKNKAAPLKTVAAVTGIKVTDDFEELDKLLSDAIESLKLVQEHMPKVRKETERLRGMKEKFRQFLEE